jgi:hypothetical protein
MAVVMAKKKKKKKWRENTRKKCLQKVEMQSNEHVQKQDYVYVLGNIENMANNNGNKIFPDY